MTDDNFFFLLLRLCLFFLPFCRLLLSSSSILWMTQWKRQSKISDRNDEERENKDVGERAQKREWAAEKSIHKRQASHLIYTECFSMLFGSFYVSFWSLVFKERHDTIVFCLPIDLWIPFLFHSALSHSLVKVLRIYDWFVFWNAMDANDDFAFIFRRILLTLCVWLFTVIWFAQWNRLNESRVRLQWAEWKDIREV